MAVLERRDLEEAAHEEDFLLPQGVHLGRSVATRADAAVRALCDRAIGQFPVVVGKGAFALLPSRQTCTLLYHKFLRKKGIPPLLADRCSRRNLWEELNLARVTDILKGTCP